MKVDGNERTWTAIINVSYCFPSWGDKIKNEISFFPFRKAPRRRMRKNLAKFCSFILKELTTIILTAMRLRIKRRCLYFVAYLPFERNLLLDVLLNRISIESSYFIQLSFHFFCFLLLLLCVFKRKEADKK